MTKKPIIQGLSDSTFDISQIISAYTRHWKAILLSIVIAFILALIYLRYTVPKYASFAKIQLLEEARANPELNLFQDLDFLMGANNTLVDDEIQILNSRTNFQEVAKNLNLNLKVFVEGNIRDNELYDNLPIRLNFIAPDSIIYRSKTTFLVDVVSENEFKFKQKKEDFSGEYAFGNEVETSLGGLIITPNTTKLHNLVGKEFRIEVTPLEHVVDYYKKYTIIVKLAEQSGILNLVLNDAIPSRGRDVLNGLIERYNQNAVNDKKAIADKTEQFIDERIAEIYSNLSDVEESAEDFKSSRGLADLQSQANVNIASGEENRRILQNVSTQLNIANSMKDFVTTQKGFDVLPANIGLQDNAIASTTEKYNRLALERKRLLESSNEQNPTIVNLDKQLEGLKNSLTSSLIGMTNNLSIQEKNLKNQVSRINSKIYNAPKNERALREITRQQQTKESLYLYLLQKREESQITFASAKPKSKIVDSAYSILKEPVTPKTPIVLVGSILLGFLLPVGFIYGKNLLDNKVHSKVDLEKLIKNVPVLAELPKLTAKEDKLLIKNDRSVLAESLRILRTNLDYILKTKQKDNSEKQNVIFVTSSVASEGKTMLSSNLALVLSGTNKRVLLIGADIRNPKLTSFFDFSNDSSDENKDIKVRKGLSQFLFDNTVKFSDLINPQQVNGFTIDTIHSGDIPPNPTELLMSERLNSLFSEASKKYDYVIVDTAPIVPVTDTMLIAQFAHQIIYVVKAGATDKKILQYPINQLEEGKLPNLSFVVNSVKKIDLGYGGKYGYGYGEKPSLIERFLPKSQ